MTKEELKQEAKEWIAKNSKEFITNPKYSPFDYAEAIYLAGAEPREKQIAELEAQIKKMQDDIDCLTFACENYREEMEKNLADATKLEKENAELKEKLGNYQKGMFDEIEKRDKQLNKAKEHIENLLYYVKQCTCERSNYAEIEKDITEAEQFLNSEVEK